MGKSSQIFTFNYFTISLNLLKYHLKTLIAHTNRSLTRDWILRWLLGYSRSLYARLLSHFCWQFSAPREKRSLLLEPLRKSIAEVSEFFRCSNMPSGPENTSSQTQRIILKTHNLSTKTLGICTNCWGLFPSFNAWDRFNICPLITDICFSNICLSKPLSVCKQFYFKISCFNF